MYQSQARGLASLGRNDDSMLVHMTPGEVQGLQKLAMSAGGSLTINPQTGLPEAGFLSSMLPMLASAAAIALAPETMGASMTTLLGAGAGAATGYLTNKQNPLMGAIMGGISGYGMGGVGSALQDAGAQQAAGVMAESNAAANLAGKQSYDTMLQSTLADRAADTGVYNNDFLNYDAAPPSYAQTPEVLAERARLDTMANQLNAPPSAELAGALNRTPQGNMMAGLQGLPSGQGFSNFIGQTAKDSATGKATGLGGGLAATAKGLGLAAPMISSALTPNKFVPPVVKPPTYYKTSYNQPQYDPATGLYSSGSYGPGSYSTVYGAEGGAVGYAEGNLVAPAYYGPPGENPKNSSDVYGDAAGEGPYNDAAGEGPYDDKEGQGVYSNTKFDKSTPAKQILAAAKTTSKARKLRALLQDNETEYAAESGLMGLHTYAAGGRLLRGPGDGMSDSIPAVIGGANPQRAALADGEFVIPADVVSHLGNGSTEAGSKHLYAMMDKVRRARTGNPKQGKQINPEKFMPA